MRFVGSCDAFVSHSWSDDGSKKFDSLCEWSLLFKAENGREPQLWVDKDCVEENNVSEDLACLPFFLSGAKKFIILAGPTYNERLWYTLQTSIYYNYTVSFSSFCVAIFFLRGSAGLSVCARLCFSCLARWLGILTFLIANSFIFRSHD